MLTQYNLKMPHAVYGGENAMDNITAIIRPVVQRRWQCSPIRASRALACSPCPRRL